MAEVDRATVVVADADAAIRSLVELTLDGERLAVVQAADVDALLDAVDRHAPAVAIVDRGLPDEGGAAACRRVKQRDGAIATVLLVRKQDLHEVDDRDGVVDALLTEPFTALALLRKVDEVLGVAR